ncbi:MAG: cadherin repeat domain-containing protein, partial [Gammaproteobacteria bacterium]|nr:cadherin repeat domain-containing protein [Gammaproteobacteria bacterium]
TVHASSTGANGQPTEVPLKVTVNVKDVQESDAVFADAMLAIDENEAEGMVGKVEATDAEGDAVAYSLAEGSPEGFSIDGATGAVSYKGEALDYETAATIDLTVIATSIGASNMATDVSRTFTVKVGDVTESDAVFKDATLSIDENEAEGMVGTVTATDAEGDDIAYRLAEGSPEGFSIDGATGAVSYKGDGLDHEEAATVDLTVIATSIGASNMETDVSRTFTVNVGDVDDLPDEPMRFVLTARPDPFTGGDADDTFIAVPERTNTGAYIPVLNPKGIDSLDGGAGMDTLTVSWAGLGGDLTLGVEGVKNIEKVVLDAFLQGVNADLRGYEGLEMVELASFGPGSNVNVTVDDGASVSVNDSLTIGGNATIVGAAGKVDIKAGTGSDVVVGSAGETASVVVKGGKSVTVAKNAAGAQSETVTSVAVYDVARDPGTLEGGRTEDRSGAREADIPATATATVNTALLVQYVRQATPEDTGAANGVIPVTAREAALDTYYIFKDQKDTPDGVSLTANQIFVTTDIENADGYISKLDAEPSSATPTVRVHSDEIKAIELHNTQAIAVVKNASQTEDSKAMPEDLAVAVNKYGKKGANMAGDLYIDGKGSAADIALTVAGASWVDLHSNAVKNLDITANAGLTLTVNKFDTTGENAPMDGERDGASESLESMTITGEGGVTMDSLEGSKNLKTIDASGSSGDNHFESEGRLALLESVMGGSGGDTVKITGAHRTAGLEVKLGEGDDTFEGDNGGNKNSRIDGGEGGRDTLKLSASPAEAVYKDGDDTKSIYSNFEVLDVGGGTGEYDVKLLGIDTEEDVLASGGTAGAVTLKNMADEMGITVEAEEKGMGATADITHELMDGLRKYSGELDVKLLAIGDDEDTRVPDATTGEVTLTLAVDSEIDEINVDSSAKPGGSKTDPATNRPGAANYQNVLVLDSAGSATVKDIYVDGDAKLVIRVSDDDVTNTLDDLDLIDASDNTGGVTFNGDDPDGDGTNISTALDNVLELVGGSAVDKLTGGGGDDEIEGGGGGDILDGGSAGADDFIIKAVSDSQLSFARVGGAPQGVDTITGFVSGEDDIVLPKPLFNSLRGVLLEQGGSIAVDVNTSTTGTDPTTLKAHLEANTTKNGFFESGSPGLGNNNSITRHSVTALREDTNGDGSVDNTWIFIDVDGDGDLDLSVDLAIKLVGFDTAFALNPDPASSDLISA